MGLSTDRIPLRRQPMQAHLCCATSWCSLRRFCTGVQPSDVLTYLPQVPVSARGGRKNWHLTGPTNYGSKVVFLTYFIVYPTSTILPYSPYWLPVVSSVYYGQDRSGFLRLPSEKRQLSSIWIGYPCSSHLCHLNTVSTPPSDPFWYLLHVGDHMLRKSSFVTETASEVSRGSRR